VNKVLYEEWAPIGLVGALPRDEYEAYAMDLVTILAKQPSAEDVTEYLLQAECRILGDVRYTSNCREVAERLLEFAHEARATVV
jgi:hypothetical protein